MARKPWNMTDRQIENELYRLDRNEQTPDALDRRARLAAELESRRMGDGDR